VLENVKYVYNAKQDDAYTALEDITCEINAGEFCVVLGHNGSGKSTFAKLLNGLYTPTEGRVTVDGMDTADDKLLYDIRSRVGVVFQNPDNQMIATIIEDDVAFGPENLGLAREEIAERVEWALGAVDMLEHRKGTPFRLSGGQKQRIAIAGVLALRPEVIVLDEATSMLDPQGRAEVMEVLRKLNREHGITVVAITHFMDEAVAADKIIVIDDARIGYVGDRALFSDPDLIKKFNLELPVASEIALKLREAGLAIGDVFGNEDMEEALCQ